MDKLAIFGGVPVRSKVLPYGRQTIDDDDIKAVEKVLRGDFVTCGPTVEEFERAIADYAGAKYAVAVSNGTAALHAACFAAGIGKDDEVITTPMTFAASANCALYMGAKPIFADISPDTFNLNPDEIRKKITKKTKAIIPVDYTGLPADMDSVNKIAEEYGLVVIEDSAHSLGAEYKGKKVGSLAHMTEFSFHPVKHITTGEGGAVVTDDEKLYKRLSMFRTHGITRMSDMLVNKEEGPWYYEQQELGYNYRITDIQCALGLSQLKKIDGFVARRREIVKMYNDALKDVEGIKIPNANENSKSSWHLFIIRLELEKLNGSRKDIFNALKAENIGVNVHYVPVYYHPYYKSLGYEKGICPITEDYYERIITLPLFPGMSDSDVNDVIMAVKKVIRYYLINP